jgi:hypothetical protein
MLEELCLEAQDRWTVAIGLRDLRVAACEESRLCDLG